MSESREMPGAESVPRAIDEFIEQVTAERDALRKIAELIGSIFAHGNFKAETYNERELQKLLTEQGCFWPNREAFEAAQEKT